MQRVYHELARVPEAFQHLQCLFVDMIRAEVLRHCAVIIVRQPIVCQYLGCAAVLAVRCSLLLVEEILDVEDVDVADLVHRVRFLFSQQYLIVRLLRRVHCMRL